MKIIFLFIINSIICNAFNPLKFFIKWKCICPFPSEDKVSPSLFIKNTTPSPDNIDIQFQQLQNNFNNLINICEETRYELENLQKAHLYEYGYEDEKNIDKDKIDKENNDNLQV